MSLRPKAKVSEANGLTTYELWDQRRFDHDGKFRCKYVLQTPTDRLPARGWDPVTQEECLVPANNKK